MAATPERPQPHRRAGLRAFRRDGRGATAVEFAIVAAPFFFMIFAIIQLALYFMVQVTLDNAVGQAARQLRTGQMTADGKADSAGKQAFLTAICNNMSWLQSQCLTGASNSSSTQFLVVDVRTLASFSSNTAPPETLNGSMNTGNFCYYSGGAGNAVELRAWYRWQLITPYLMKSLQTFNGGVSELQSTEVFQVEPNGQTNSSATPC